MKAYKEYLAESKRTYDFRIKLADCDCGPELMDGLERGLAQFNLVDITKPKRFPISRCAEFHTLGPVERNMIDVKLNYPTTPNGLRQAVSQSTGMPLSHIHVTTELADSMEVDPVSNHEEGSVLNTAELGGESAQEFVGLKKVESLLKELGKNRGTLSQYKGVNDQILADKAPTEAPAKKADKIGTMSPVGSRQNKIPSPGKGR
jgi:hypothetical protein